MDEPADLDKLIVRPQYCYIEHNRSLQVLFQAKFLAQQKFLLEKTLLEQQLQKDGAPPEMTNLEDLFDAGLTLQNNDEVGVDKSISNLNNISEIIENEDFSDFEDEKQEMN